MAILMKFHSPCETSYFRHSNLSNMKYALYFTVIASAFLLASCNKCADCKCDSTISYEFNGYSAAEEDLIQETTNAAYERDFPDEEKEVCDRRGKKYDDAIADYEAKSDVDSLTTGSGSVNYSYVWTRTCTCEE